MADPIPAAIMATLAAALLAIAAALIHAVFVTAWHEARRFFGGSVNTRGEGD